LAWQDCKLNSNRLFLGGQDRQRIANGDPNGDPNAGAWHNLSVQGGDKAGHWSVGDVLMRAE